MSETLLDAARRHAERHADPDGVAATPVPGLVVIRRMVPSELQYAISRPLVALVLQGGKRVSIGSRTFEFGAGESLLITADVPTASRIARASAAAPYISLVLELDLSVVGSMVAEMGPTPFAAGEPVRVDPTESGVSNAALRVLLLAERPDALRILQASLIREIHYWLLAGRHGGAIRNLGVADSHAQRVGRAVAVIRTEYATSLPVERLAGVAGMSLSAFHSHFRAITSLTPLQFQKQLRLIEARRLMMAEGARVAVAAHAVGYASVQQFTREYGRMFGDPPARDMLEAKAASSCTSSDAREHPSVLRQRRI